MSCLGHMASWDTPAEASGPPSSFVSMKNSSGLSSVELSCSEHVQ